ncbi:MAG TPA: hypothetical protein VF730_12175 [Terracidiphilus sp.]
MSSIATTPAHVHHYPPVLEIVHPILDKTVKLLDGPINSGLPSK